jgi:hypothetical protein
LRVGHVETEQKITGRDTTNPYASIYSISFDPLCEAAGKGDEAHAWNAEGDIEKASIFEEEASAQVRFEYQIMTIGIQDV